ncbi:likely protein kinase [Stylonychia lemnae]|uniref:Likely protein kinase n=1 Tax=Stylonychia lemnae TaxID=5949 RepID=A0A078A0X1_STYLE|nr:likely protein kinase [Stylonychia lemnae]|eukprot:CDW75512.1 likely protein kinase [Stylonychia lemnae]
MEILNLDNIEQLAEQDLDKYVKLRFDQRNYLTCQEVSMIFLQILNALEYIHDKSFIHRDISPQNILVFEDLSIKICDFGFASHGQYTQANVGKQEYIAPEVSHFEGKNYNNSIDIWSLGILLYYLCSGQTKSKGIYVNDLAKEKKHIDLPEKYSQFQVIFDQMLDFEPENRPTATKVKDDIMKLIDQGDLAFQQYQQELQAYQLKNQEIKIIKQEEELEKQLQKYFNKDSIQCNKASQISMQNIYQSLEKQASMVRSHLEINDYKKFYLKEEEKEFKSSIFHQIQNISMSTNPNIKPKITLKNVMNTQITKLKKKKKFFSNENLKTNILVGFSMLLVILSSCVNPYLTSRSPVIVNDQRSDKEIDIFNLTIKSQSVNVSSIIEKIGEFNYGSIDKIHPNANRIFENLIQNEDLSIYQGEYDNQTKKRDGRGRYIYSNGDIYDGLWKNNLRDGYGRLLQNDRNYYIGEWKDDKFHGFGKYYHNNW